MQDHSDRELLSLFRNPDQKNYAFNIIVRKYQERLYWHIRKMIIVHDDTDDLLQNTFMKAWKGLENFREESQLYTWLYRIATNEALSFLKEKRKKYFIPMVDVEKELSSGLEGDSYFNGEELQLRLQKAILKLPEKQRLVFNMRYFDEMKYEDMAGILDTSVGALKASYHHAAKKIENMLKTN
ncbi:MAG: sigma-70 family RNA polymerase sigma factor [Bacteroidales bacterium]